MMRVPQASNRWQALQQAVALSTKEAEREQARQRVEDARLDGPRGYGSQLKAWVA
jgi:hypothetical protein